MSFEFRFKGVNKARLSDVSWEVIPEERLPIGKGPAPSRLFFGSWEPSGALNFEIVMPELESVPSSFPLIREGRGVLLHFSPKGLQGLLGPNPVFLNGRRPGYILDESPAHRRTLTDGSGCLHKVPTAHQEQLWGSLSCSRILRHVAQSCPGEPGFKPATF